MSVKNTAFVIAVLAFIILEPRFVLNIAVTVVIVIGLWEVLCSAVAWFAMWTLRHRKSRLG